MSDSSKTKIREPCKAGGIHEYICLIMCQYDGKTGFRITTHPPEVTVNYVSRVEEVKAFGDIIQLVRE